MIARLRAVTVLTDNGSVQWFHVPITYTHMGAADGSDDRALAWRRACCFWRVHRPERVNPTLLVSIQPYDRGTRRACKRCNNARGEPKRAGTLKSHDNIFRSEGTRYLFTRAAAPTKDNSACDTCYAELTFKRMAARRQSAEARARGLQPSKVSVLECTLWRGPSTRIRVHH